MLQGKDLASDHPSQWTPSRGEEKDVDADKSDASLLSRLVVNDDITLAVLACGQGTQHGD